MTLGNALRVTQLIACGAVIGLYVAKLFGFAGIEVTPRVESFGVASGASVIVILKFMHFV